jgi:hypothetical protein
MKTGELFKLKKGELYSLSWCNDLTEAIHCYVVAHLTNNEYVCTNDTYVLHPRGQPLMIVDPAPFIYEDDYHADCRLALASNDDYVICLYKDKLLAIYDFRIEPLIVYHNSAKS